MPDAAPSPVPALSGLTRAVAADPDITAFAEAAGRPDLTVTAVDGARPFLVSALADRAPVLVATATGREADDLTSELREMLGDGAVAQFPSWETLPHERLSPGADTVGRRLQVLRRLAHPEDAQYGEPLRAVVATVRSLVQPMAPGLGDAPSITLREGVEHDFDQLIETLVELAYTRVDMVGKRGEFAVRGGILDVFPTTTDLPVRVEFWGDEITDLRAFSVADQRSQPEVEVGTVHVYPCRELLLTAEVRERAAALKAEHESDAALVEMLEKLSQGIPVEGMEALIPALIPGELQLLTDVLPRARTPCSSTQRRSAPAQRISVAPARSSSRPRGPRPRSARPLRSTRRE
ncbi:Transcription-repair-coupling factor (plasmid) [Tsukamurella tyrosinosolvens]|nr:Transcription-repair-coupling factor [Tsukamurella tyrosinosolvens]